MQKIICHACCAVCLMFPLQKLRSLELEPIVYFYNPNIYPSEEYERRFNELERYCNKNSIELVHEVDSQDVWNEAVKGLEQEPEKGKRCEVCFRLRLEKTAQYAKQRNIPFITTTLTVSPHKNSKMIFNILDEISQKYEIEYLKCDFKKENGFLITNQIAAQENFYRQKYCGCKYSIRT